MNKIIAILALAIIFTSFTSTSEAASSKMKFKPKANVKLAKVIPAEFLRVEHKDYAGGSYTGLWSKSKPNGAGTLEYPDMFLQGVFKDGELEGASTLTKMYDTGEKIISKGVFHHGILSGKVVATYYSNNVKTNVFIGELDHSGKVNGGIVMTADHHPLYQISTNTDNFSGAVKSDGYVIEALDEGIKADGFYFATLFTDGTAGIEYGSMDNSDPGELQSYEGMTTIDIQDLVDLNPLLFQVPEFMTPEGEGMMYWCDGSTFESDEMLWGTDMDGTYMDRDGTVFEHTIYNMETGEIKTDHEDVLENNDLTSDELTMQ